MKIRLTEAQIKMLSENYPQSGTPAGTGAVINTLSDTNKTQAAITNVGKLKNAIDTLKTSIKTENEDNGESTVRLELGDHLDDLLLSLYGFTYFRDRSTPEVSMDDPQAPSLFPNKQSAKNVPFYPKMSPDQQSYFDKELGGFMNTLKSGDPDKLNDLFTKLIRLKQSKQSIREKKDFVDSEIFRIIAEAERPRLTKKEFIDYIKAKK